MNLSQYTIKDDPEVSSYADDLTKDRLVYNDYFYFSQNSFIDNNEIYEEKQVARILACTDKEYYELIEKYFGGDNSGEDNSEKENVQKKIDEINAKIQKSKDFEEAEKKTKALKTELEKLDKDLKSYDGLQGKIREAHGDIQNFEQLKRFNLQKIHDDLVSINSQIDKFEEQLISDKIVEIKESKEKYEMDAGKVGLAISLMVGMGIFGGVFIVLNLPVFISYAVWSIGIFAGLIIIFFSRTKSTEYYENNENSTNPHEIEKAISILKSQRNAILNFVGMKSTNEFFLQKARFSAAKKNLDYLHESSKDLNEKLNLEEIRESRNKAQKELEDLTQKTQDNTILLKPDEYLNLYRELDALKLQLGGNSVAGVSKADIPKKLADIRKELSDKLPSYVTVLKNTYQRSYEKINQDFNTKIQSTGMPTKILTKDLSEWSTLSLFEKFIIELSMARDVYTENFVFFLEEISTWPQEDIDLLRIFVNKSNELKVDLYILDYQKTNL